VSDHGLLQLRRSARHQQSGAACLAMSGACHSGVMRRHRDRRPRADALRSRFGIILALVLGVILLGARAQADPRLSFGLPSSCRLGSDCFVQQMPDIDPGQGVLDPLCGKASYQGHNGWDIRLRTLEDIARNVPVIAVADGKVLRVRDGVPDRIFEEEKDRASLTDKECGNGAVIEHKEGLTSQYCHLKSGSLAVRPGSLIRKGDQIGSMGSSGLAEFPHVHLSVRRDGKLVEPLLGQVIAAESRSCGDVSRSLFEPSARQSLMRPPVAILDFGLANAPPKLADLVRKSPPLANSGGEATVAWLWAINVEEGYQFRIQLIGPDQVALIDHSTGALARRKANYLAYFGRKVSAKVGEYSLKVEILSGGKRIDAQTRSIRIAE
jgi:murein DD-endopeptidase MepM/ murein hydrolase activator NlpD